MLFVWTAEDTGKDTYHNALLHSLISSCELVYGDDISAMRTR